MQIDVESLHARITKQQPQQLRSLACKCCSMDFSMWLSWEETTLHKSQEEDNVTHHHPVRQLRIKTNLTLFWILFCKDFNP
jgi:hypothetical protein